MFIGSKIEKESTKLKMFYYISAGTKDSIVPVNYNSTDSCMCVCVRAWLWIDRKVFDMMRGGMSKREGP